MNYGEVMLYAVQLDTWKQRFNAIIEYNNLQTGVGYKFSVRNSICYLDPPSFLQNISRWYYGYNKEQFLHFLEDNKQPFFQFLNDIVDSPIITSRSKPAMTFMQNLVFFLSELARSCSVSRNVYPDFTELNMLLLTYFHGIREWLVAIGY